MMVMMAVTMNGLLVVLTLIAAIQYSDAGWAEYEEYIKSQATNETFLKLFKQHLKKFENNDPLKLPQFPCSSFPQQKRAVTAHTLSPSDINVVAAIGDSITAGTGITATNPLALLIQNRGLSWSVGGDGNVEEHVTIPNIIKKYNPNVKGFSVGNGNVHNKNSHLNMAVPGDTSFEMPGQARELIKRMQNEEEDINFEKDWKLITMFVGGNDLCSYCSDPEVYSVANYVYNIQQALDILHESVPRAFVNVVEVLNIGNVYQLNEGLVCDALHLFLCQCGAYPSEKDKQMMQEGVKLYQEGLKNLIESGRYDTREDFTVVTQPFFEETPIPKMEDGSADLSYFAPDCFHLSAKGHKAAAEALWNNMVESEKEKKREWTPNESVECPTADNPYFYTRLNSKSGSLGNTFEETPTEEVDNISNVSDGKQSVGSVVGISVGIAALVCLMAVTIYIALKKQKGRKEKELLLKKTVNMSYTEI